MKTKSLSHSYATFTIVLLLLCVGNTPLFAASSLEVSGWIPYWRVSGGTRDARTHIDALTEIHPFGYVVTEDGGLDDLAGLKKSAWKRLFTKARGSDVRVIPTVMWSDGTNIHTILSDPKLRAAHIKKIVSMVKKGGFDGVDIDYEAKLTKTKDSFSLFLKELKTALPGKMLTCAIEARTPADSLYRTVPATIEYSNDLVAIGKYCDRVQIMTYDQRRADIKLNDARKGAPYMPVADIDWVRKVVEHMLLSIPKEKLVLGIATYGHEYEVTVAPQWFRDYRRIRALNPKDALDIADDENITPSRNSAGEMSISYLPSSSNIVFPKTLSIPKNTSSGNKVAAQALAYANMTGVPVTFNFISWSDAGAIGDKINLVEEFDLRGVALFKIDGEEDRDIWDILEE
ncbi:MAG: glycosyl hydrolase family 18 protein [Patescibacteria group bacterium]